MEKFKTTDDILREIKENCERKKKEDNIIERLEKLEKTVDDIKKKVNKK